MLSERQTCLQPGQTPSSRISHKSLMQNGQYPLQNLAFKLLELRRDRVRPPDFESHGRVA